MASLNNYKGLQVLDSAIGNGGEAINDDFKLLVDWNPKCNWEATNDPATNNDVREDEDYQVGSRWFNTTTGAMFICVDATLDEAVWQGSSQGTTSRTLSASLSNVEQGPLLNSSTDTTGFIPLSPAGVWAFDATVFAKASVGFGSFDTAVWELKGAVHPMTQSTARILGTTLKNEWADPGAVADGWDVEVQIQGGGIKIWAQVNGSRDVDWTAIVELKKMA